MRNEDLMNQVKLYIFCFCASFDKEVNSPGELWTKGVQCSANQLEGT